MKIRSLELMAFCVYVAFAFIICGCDTEKLDYEDEGTYTLFDSSSMAPPSPQELQEAINILKAWQPESHLGWAYSVVASLFGIGVDAEDISVNEQFEISAVASKLTEAGVIGGTELIIDILQSVITEANKPGFDDQDPKNSAIVALASSLENSGIQDADDINANTQLNQGDIILLVLSMHQAAKKEAPYMAFNNNSMAVLVDQVYDGNNMDIEDSEIADDMGDFV
jgi:hypothetical protein